MIQGSKSDAEDGNLVCLLAGDNSLYRDCKSTFEAMSKKSSYLSKIKSFYKLFIIIILFQYFYFLGDQVGAATKLNLILHSIKAVSLAGLAEGMALAARAEISHTTMLETLGMTSLKCPLLIEKGKGISVFCFIFFYLILI